MRELMGETGSTPRGDILPGEDTPSEACKRDECPGSCWESIVFGENTLVLIGESKLCCCCWNWLRMAFLWEGEKIAPWSELYLGEEAISAEKRSSRLEGVRVLVRAERFPADEPSREYNRSLSIWTSKSGNKEKSSTGISLALSEVRNLLDWRLLPGRCSIGTLGCGHPTPEWPIPLAEGDIGGVKGDMTAETDEGEPGIRPTAAAISIAAEVADRGDGTAEPVDTYSGRSSSFVWAKKHILRAQLVPSLQSLVRYCAGWSQHSNTPCAYSHISPLLHAPFRKSGQGTQL